MHYLKLIYCENVYLANKRVVSTEADIFTVNEIDIKPF